MRGQCFEALLSMTWRYPVVWNNTVIWLLAILLFLSFRKHFSSSLRFIHVRTCLRIDWFCLKVWALLFCFNVSSLSRFRFLFGAGIGLPCPLSLTPFWSQVRTDRPLRTRRCSASLPLARAVLAHWYVSLLIPFCFPLHSLSTLSLHTSQTAVCASLTLMVLMRRLYDLMLIYCVIRSSWPYKWIKVRSSLPHTSESQCPHIHWSIFFPYKQLRFLWNFQACNKTQIIPIATAAKLAFVLKSCEAWCKCLHLS